MTRSFKASPALIGKRMFGKNRKAHNPPRAKKETVASNCTHVETIAPAPVTVNTMDTTSTMDTTTTINHLDDVIDLLLEEIIEEMGEEAMACTYAMATPKATQEPSEAAPMTSDGRESDASWIQRQFNRSEVKPALPPAPIVNRTCATADRPATTSPKQVYSASAGPALTTSIAPLPKEKTISVPAPAVVITTTITRRRMTDAEYIQSQLRSSYKPALECEPACASAASTPSTITTPAEDSSIIAVEDSPITLAEDSSTTEASFLCSSVSAPYPAIEDSATSEDSALPVDAFEPLPTAIVSRSCISDPGFNANPMPFYETPSSISKATTSPVVDWKPLQSRPGFQWVPYVKPATKASHKAEAPLPVPKMARGPKAYSAGGAEFSYLNAARGSLSSASE